MAPSTYYAAKQSSARRPGALRDIVMMQVLMALWVANRKVYGAHKLWKAARRAGHDIGRDQVARLMRQLGIRACTRRKKVFTTRPDPDAVRAPDLVNRDFTADRPDALWVTDLTYVPTRSGMAYVCFIVDAFSRTDRGLAGGGEHEDRDGPRRVRDGPVARGGRRLVGSGGALRRRPSNSPRCGSPNAWRRSARGPSIGTVADSYDNALAETTNGLYKAECVYGPDATGWDDVDHVELATLSWVHWFNNDRLTATADDIPPAEFEAAFYAAQQTDHPWLESNSPSLQRTQGGSITAANRAVLGGDPKPALLPRILATAGCPDTRAVPLAETLDPFRGCQPERATGEIRAGKKGRAHLAKRPGGGCGPPSSSRGSWSAPVDLQPVALPAARSTPARTAPSCGSTPHCPPAPTTWSLAGLSDGAAAQPVATEAARRRDRWCLIPAHRNTAPMRRRNTRPTMAVSMLLAGWPGSSA